MAKNICCSAPGKVLISGGYLVLERPNPGLVFTVNARFYSKIQTFEGEEIVETKAKRSRSSSQIVPIVVESPQFGHVEEYTIDYNNEMASNTFQLNPKSENPKKNPYTENSISITLKTISQFLSEDQFHSLLIPGLKISILADNDFYSQRDLLLSKNMPLNSDSLSKLPKFQKKTDEDIEKIRKTGLGSSAALVTSLVGALCSYFGIISLPGKSSYSKDISIHKVEADLKLVHNLAQFCHCLAQGKIGSGFDVSSATYGSQKYVRFSKEIIEPFLNQDDVSSLQLRELFTSSKWNNQINRFNLPKGMVLMLGDVGKGGSNTPGMVSKVLSWKNTYSLDAKRLFTQLNEANILLEDLFKKLNDLQKEDTASYVNALKYCSFKPAEKWENCKVPTVEILIQIRTCFSEIRQNLREMGIKSQVEIEPREQEKLVNETMETEGVLIAGVPGAGGYDAIFAILLDQSSRQKLENLWIQKGVLPLILNEESIGVCIDEIPNVSK